MAEYLDEISAANAVSLHDIYRVIAGHSYYHGDHILAALTCIAEGKEVNPVRPADVAPVVYGRWKMRPTGMATDTGPEYKAYCTVCNEPNKQYQPPFCPHCGAKMDIQDENEELRAMTPQGFAWAFYEANKEVDE